LQAVQEEVDLGIIVQLTTLEKIWTRGDLIEAFKIFKSCDKINPERFFTGFELSKNKWGG
jgi:hypothetical protein